VPRRRENPERGVPADSGEMLWKNSRQDEPDPVRHSLLLFRPHGAIQEVLLVGCEERRRLPTEELHIRQRASERGKDNQRADQELPPGVLEEPKHLRHDA
jgi:hypothetical protein